MAIEAQLCPQCGAAVQFAEGQTQVVCAHCGTSVARAAAPSLEKELADEKLIQETIQREKKLHSHGRPATGKLVSAQATDIFRPTVEGRAVLMSVAIEVQPEGEAPFAAEAKVLIGLSAIEKYRPGTLLDVRYDPQDRAQVSVEGRHGVPSSNPEAQARQRHAREQAQRQAQLAEQAEAAASAAPAAPAWGGPRPAGSVPAPAEFEQVTHLGPAMAVHAHQDQGLNLIPHFGPPRASALVLYRDGLAFRTSKDLQAWRWEEVAAIVSNTAMHDNDHHVWTAHEYTLAKSGADKVIVDDGLKGIEAAIQTIKQTVFARLLPPLAQAYGADQAVTFGPVTVHKQTGLQLLGQLYAWSAIQDIKIERGRFTLTLRDGKPHEARVSAIPNIELLGRLIGLEFYESALAYF